MRHPSYFKKKQAKGFTLIEMLIAISIFAIISIVSYSALNRLIKDVGFFQQRNQQNEEIKLLSRVISHDLLYLINRPVNSFRGVRNAFIINNPNENNSNSNNLLLEFTRRGVKKIGINKETGLVRVSYILEDNDLKRAEYTYLDYREEPDNYTLIASDISEFKTEILTSNNVWTPKWEINGLPRAIKITITKGNGDNNKVYEIIIPGLMND